MSFFSIYLCTHFHFINLKLLSQWEKLLNRYSLSPCYLAQWGGVKAQEDEVFDFDASFYHSWSEVSATATDNGEADGGVKIGEEVDLGGTIWGNLSGSVPHLSYANITDYSELRFEGTPGAVIRLMCNRTVNEGPIYEIKPTIGEDGKLTVNISDLKYLNGGTPCDFVCLQSIKVPAAWQGGTTAATITSIKIVKPADPLSVPKTSLKNAINDGKKQNAFGKSSASFSALTTAISNGETELANGSATAESLNAAAKAITDAISGLKLADGYTNLTADMYKKWDSDTKPTSGTDDGCIYALGTSNGQPYGDGSVKWYHFADISDFSALHLLTAEGTPRVMMNRAYAAEGDGGDYVQITDAPEDGKVSIDLTAYAYAHMNAIKGANWANVMITDMLLYRTLTVGDAKFATFGSLYKNAKLNGVTAYAAKYSVGKVTLTEVTNVPAGKGVVVEAAAAGSYAPTFDVAADDIDTDLQVSNGTVTGDGSTIFVLANGGNGVGFYKLADGVKVPAGKAYLVIPASARDFIGFADEATGISTSLMNNGKVNNEVFNLKGQRVSQPTKGLYIVNGKKVVIK